VPVIRATAATGDHGAGQAPVQSAIVGAQLDRIAVV
jgi:hypothetical protein